MSPCLLSYHYDSSDRTKHEHYFVSTVHFTVKAEGTENVALCSSCVASDDKYDGRCGWGQICMAEVRREWKLELFFSY